MGQSIHRNGQRYRVWSTIVDAYITPPLTRKQMLAALIEDAVATATREAEESLARADAAGTSARFKTREATAWETEKCDHCGGFHHAFRLREADAKCAVCGEGIAAVHHGPRCVKRRRTKGE